MSRQAGSCIVLPLLRKKSLQDQVMLEIMITKNTNPPICPYSSLNWVLPTNLYNRLSIIILIFLGTDLRPGGIRSFVQGCLISKGQGQDLNWYVDIRASVLSLVVSMGTRSLSTQVHCYGKNSYAEALSNP